MRGSVHLIRNSIWSVGFGQSFLLLWSDRLWTGTADVGLLVLEKLPASLPEEFLLGLLGLTVCCFPLEIAKSHSLHGKEESGS